MKPATLIAAILGLFVFISCNAGDDTPEPGSYADSAAYATIYLIDSAEATDDEDDSEDDSEDNSDEEKYYFKTDNGIKLFLVDNTITAKYDLVEGKRIIIYFSAIEDYSKEGNETLEGALYGCDYGLRLFGVREVHASTAAVVTTEEEEDAIEDHAISYLYNNISFGGNYINLLLGARADDIDDVRFYLVDNQFEAPSKSYEGYLNLELRYDRGTDEAMGLTYEEFVSLDVTPFEEQLEGMDGVLLRVVTLNSGTVYIKVDIKDESDSKALKMTTKTF